MAKRSKKIVEPDPVDKDENLVIDDDDDDDENGLTCTKRYTVSRFIPEKSSGGSKHWKDFFETNTLAVAKKEAEKVVKAENIPVTIWDREKWFLDHLLISPEIKEDEDGTIQQKTTAKSSSSTKKRGSGSGGTDGSVRNSDTAKPKPKHRRRNS